MEKGIDVIYGNNKKKDIKYTPIRSRENNNTRFFPKQNNSGIKIYSGAKKAKKLRLVKKIKTYALLTVTVGTIAFVIKDELSKEDITIEMSSNDTLSGISNDFDVPLEDIMRDNGINDANNVDLGEEINLTTKSKNVDDHRDDYNIIYEENRGKAR